MVAADNECSYMVSTGPFSQPNFILNSIMVGHTLGLSNVISDVCVSVLV